MSAKTNVLINDWCQQYPSHSIGDLALRPRRRPLRQRRRRGELQLRRLGPGRQPGQPVRRPARRRRRRPDPADRRGRRAAQPGRRAPPAIRPASTARCFESTPTPAPALPGNPLRRQLRRQPAPDRGLRLPQPVPLHRPPRHRARSGSATSAGTTGRRSTASLDPSDSASRQPRLALLRGRRRDRAATTAPTSTSARTSTRQGAGAVVAPYYAYNHSAKVVAGESCPTGSSVDRRASLL